MSLLLHDILCAFLVIISPKITGERHPAWADAGGTTACVVLMVGKQLTIANCGDSRWVLGRRRDTKSPLEFKDLSVDQNPDDPAEKARVHRMGGWVGKEEDSSEVEISQ